MVMIYQQQQQQQLQQQNYYGEMTDGCSTPTQQHQALSYNQYSSPRMMPSYGQAYSHSVPMSPVSMAGTPFCYPNVVHSGMPSPIAPMPSSPVKDGSSHFQRICMAPPSPTPLRKDSAKEETRKTIQKRLRMKIIRKGQIPPNPTMEELHLCGVNPMQAIPIQMPVYYFQNPYEAAYPYMQQTQYGMYPPSPAAYGMSPMTYAAYNKPRSVSVQEQFDYQALQRQQEYQYHQAVQQSYEDSCASAKTALKSGPEPNIYGNYGIEGLFSEEMMQEAQHLATNLEPFMLPDRAEQHNDSQFEQYFNTEVTL